MTFDLTAAPDTTENGTLLSRSLCWYWKQCLKKGQSYLTERSSFVHAVSDEAPLTCGVPKGLTSVLSKHHVAFNSFADVLWIHLASAVLFQACEDFSKLHLNFRNSKGEKTNIIVFFNLVVTFFRVLLNMTDYLYCKRCFLSAMALLAKVELYLSTKDLKSDPFFCYTRTGLLLLWLLVWGLNMILSVAPADGAEHCCCSTALQH